jgi:hypothetical protein
MKILTSLDYYLPGFKAGGPTRTVSLMVSQLPETLEFLIGIGDADHTDQHAYPGIRTNQWTDVGRAKVWYLPKRDISIASLTRLVRTVKPDAIYANRESEFPP